MNIDKMIHITYKNLLLNKNVDNHNLNKNINYLINNTWLTPLINYCNYDPLMSLKKIQMTRMRFIRIMNNFCDHLKHIDSIIGSNYLQGKNTYKILKELDYTYVISNKILTLKKIFNKLNNYTLSDFVINCIILYTLNSNEIIFNNLNKFINNRKNDIFKWSKGVVPLVYLPLDMGHFIIIGYDLFLDKNIIFLMGGSDGFVSEYNYSKLIEYLDKDIVKRRKCKLYDDNKLYKIINKYNSIQTNILKYVF